jgi:tetratricopeptide (TPR) repeat protein
MRLGEKRDHLISPATVHAAASVGDEHHFGLAVAIEVLAREVLVENHAEPSRCLEASLKLPVVRILFLEAFANVLSASGEKEKEIQVWKELFAISQNLGLELGQAEAKQKAANLEAQLKRTDEAIKDYAVAADLYGTRRKLDSGT